MPIKTTLNPWVVPETHPLRQVRGVPVKGRGVSEGVGMTCLGRGKGPWRQLSCVSGEGRCGEERDGLAPWLPRAELEPVHRLAAQRWFPCLASSWFATTADWWECDEGSQTSE